VRYLLDDAGIGHQVEAEPAELLADGQAEEAQFLHALDNLRRIGPGVLHLHDHRVNLTPQELLHGLHHGALFRVHFLHAWPPPWLKRSRASGNVLPYATFLAEECQRAARNRLGSTPDFARETRQSVTEVAMAVYGGR